MFRWFFKNSNKEDIENVKEDVKNSFEKVKKDFENVGKWVNHFGDQHNSHKNDISELKESLSTIKNDLEELKEMVSMQEESVPVGLFKKTNSRLNKQTAVGAVQTPVQTPVQTSNFYGISNLTVTEKAVVWILANNEMKLSYEDLAAMLGKTKSTIRGQINSIKQKSEGLIEEYRESNGKKRVYMPEEIKEKVLKKAKVSVKRKKKKDYVG